MSGGMKHSKILYAIALMLAIASCSSRNDETDVCDAVYLFKQGGTLKEVDSVMHRVGYTYARLDYWYCTDGESYIFSKESSPDEQIILFKTAERGRVAAYKPSSSCTEFKFEIRNIPRDYYPVEKPDTALGFSPKDEKCIAYFKKDCKDIDKYVAVVGNGDDKKAKVFFMVANRHAADSTKKYDESESVEQGEGAIGRTLSSCFRDVKKATEKNPKPYVVVSVIAFIAGAVFVWILMTALKSMTTEDKEFKNRLQKWKR